MSWIKWIARSPVFLKVLVAALQLAARIVGQERRKTRGEK